MMRLPKPLRQLDDGTPSPLVMGAVMVILIFVLAGVCR